MENPTSYDVDTQTFTVSSSTPIQYERMGVNTIPQKLFDCPASSSFEVPSSETLETDDDRTENRLPKPLAAVVAETEEDDDDRTDNRLTKPQDWPAWLPWLPDRIEPTPRS